MMMLLCVAFTILLAGIGGLIGFDRYIRREQKAWLDAHPVEAGLRRARWRERPRAARLH